MDVASLNFVEQLSNFDVILFVFTETSQTYFDFDLSQKFVGTKQLPN